MQKESNECSIKSLLKRTLQFKKELIFGNIFALLATITTVIVPLFIPMLIDELLLHKEPRLTAFVSKYIMPMSLPGYVAFFWLWLLFCDI